MTEDTERAIQKALAAARTQKKADSLPPGTEKNTKDLPAEGSRFVAGRLLGKVGGGDG